MGYRVPSKARLLEAIERVLTASGAIPSQTLLTSLVADELHAEDPAFRVSGERVRRVALASPRIKIQITARRTDDQPIPDRCPVCGQALSVKRNATLDGRLVALESKCTSCPYWTGSRRRVPMRYQFHMRSWFGTKQPK